MWNHDGRVAFTASGMVTLLHILRSLPPNGFCLWDSVVRVHLGDTPTHKDAVIMATRIFNARTLPMFVRNSVTPEALVDHLVWQNSSALPITAPRPALIAYFLDMICGDDLEVAGCGEASPSSMLRRSLDRLVSKLMTESLQDSAAALSNMGVPLRLSLYTLANSGRWGVQLASVSSGILNSRSFLEFLAALCEPVAPQPVQLSDEIYHDSALSNLGMQSSCTSVSCACAPTVNQRIIPPYGALINSMLGSDGAVLIALRHERWTADDELIRLFAFFL